MPSLLELAIELDAVDFAVEEDGYGLRVAPESYQPTREALEARGIAVAATELAMVPQSQVELDGDQAAQMLRLLDALEENDDVQNVWTNFDDNGSPAATAD